MNKEVQNAISELNDNIDNFIKTNEQELKEIKEKMVKREAISLPLSNRMDEETYKKSDFSEYIRNGSETFLKKALTEDVGKDGEYFLPNKITTQVYDRMKFLSPMRGIAKTMMVSTNSVDMIVDSKNPDAGWTTGDARDATETDSPQINKIKIPVHEIYAKPTASQRLLDDSQINVEEWLINKIAEKFAILEDDAFINGDGADKPNGFLKCESEESEQRNFGKLQHFCSGANGGFIDDKTAVNTLIDITCSLKPIYVKNAKWIMSRSALAEIRKLKNKDGMSLWQPSFSESTPSTLLGYQVIVDDNMPSLKLGVESISVAFGDFYSGYQIIDRQGFKILRDPYTSKPFIEFYATKRVGGAVVDFDAIKLLNFKGK